MVRTLMMVLALGMAGAAQAEEVPRSPDTMLREAVSPEDIRFFFNEARQAARAASRGETYVPDPAAAERAREIAARMRQNGFSVIESILDQMEKEMLKPYPKSPAKPQNIPEQERT